MQILDDFISSEEVRYALQHAWDLLPANETAWMNYPTAAKTLTNVWETLAANIWSLHFSEGSSSVSPLGYEYWGNDIAQGEVLGWHKDKDEDVYDSSGKVICPKVGAIYYPFNDPFEGGFLEVALEDDFDRIERFEAKPNRLIIFDPSSYHRVTKVYSGYRKAFVVNVWQDHLPKVARKGDIYKNTSFGKLYNHGL